MPAIRPAPSKPRPRPRPQPRTPAPLSCPGCQGGYLLCRVNGLVCVRCTGWKPAR